MDDLEPESDAVSQLVVVGSSAGGVEALLALVASLPADFPAPIVVAQHLDPRQPSHLGSLLAGRTRLPVRTVSSRDPLQAGTIYVVPADRDVEISDHHVDVQQRPERAPKPSVDRLLASAARVFGDALIAVVLTGTGSDGAAGAQAVKAYGGTVIIQNPETARFPGMPQAVPQTAIDVIADLEAIGPLLVDLLTGAYVLPATVGKDGLRPFLKFVRDQTGLDFAVYKRPTIARRLQRRMAAVGTDSLADYWRYIERHPDELQRLVASFLIKVTEFFRDPEIFAYLREQILPGLIAEARERGELRIWSAGCSTGEEAYSLAMLLVELLGDDIESFPIRIFATDVAVDAVEFARRGIYPASAVSDLPREVLARHFVPVDGGYEVRKAVRGLVIFGEHDLAHRAPFPRIDLVLCRNVLIYFVPELQRRALQLFAFSLRRDGYLVLGKSESVSPLPDFFALEQARLRVFRRVGAATPVPANQVLEMAPLDAGGRRSARRAVRRVMPPRYEVPGGAAFPPRADRLLEELSIGVATVNRDYDVVTINAAGRRLLRINTAAIGEDLVHRAPPDLAQALRVALDGAIRGEATSTKARLARDVIDGEGRELLIACSPIWSDGAGNQTEEVLVQVTDITSSAQRVQDLESERERLLADQAELREQSATAIAELRELRAINQTLATEQGRLRMEVELLQLAHEEAQAASEEIETLNEEQQATNEELETVNEELQATVEELQATIGELSTTNDELQSRSSELEVTTRALQAQHQSADAERTRLAAILRHMGDAVLVVDASGDAVLTNAAFDRLFGSVAFVPEDAEGEPLAAEQRPQQRAAQGERFMQPFTLRGADGTRRWFESNAQPVLDSEGERWGVLVIRDITERSLRQQQEQFLAMAAHELRTPLAVLSGRLQLLIRRLEGGNVAERIAEHAHLALEQARRLEADIDELMDAARQRFGQIELSREPVDLRAIAREAAEMAHPLTVGQEIHLDLPRDALLVDGDRRRLQRVLLNLLRNAIVYAPGTEQIEVRLAQADGAARIEVVDTGPGIPAEALPHIFDRFYRGEQATGSQGGLGLGLSIAQEIVAAHDGTIEARSTVGEGTTIEIRLPLLAAP